MKPTPPTKSPPKKAAAVAVAVKKNVNRSPIKIVSPPTSSGGVIRSLETAVADIVISVVYKKPGDSKHGAFLKPLVDAWRDDDPTTQDWYIDSILPRRDDTTDQPMKTAQGLPYIWQCIVTLRGNTEETPTEIGKRLAASFSSFRGADDFQKKFQFESDSSETPPGSLNRYLLDRDCIVYLKKVYFGVKKETIEQNDQILNEFFGSPQLGKRILSQISDAEWDDQPW